MDMGGGRRVKSQTINGRSHAVKSLHLGGREGSRKVQPEGLGEDTKRRVKAEEASPREKRSVGTWLGRVVC